MVVCTAWKMPEIDRPVSVASWRVVVAARPEKPCTCMFRRGSKMWSDSEDIEGQNSEAAR